MKTNYLKPPRKLVPKSIGKGSRRIPISKSKGKSKK